MVTEKRPVLLTVSDCPLPDPLKSKRAITIPFAFAGPWLWELSWLLYPVLRYLLGLRAKGD